MSDLFSRRDVLKQIGFAGAGAVIAPAVIRGQSSPIRIAGMPVEIAVASVSPTTVRITAAGIAGAAGVPDDGALVRGAEAKPLGRVRASDASNRSRRAISSSASRRPPTIHIDDRGRRFRNGAGRQTGVSFLLPRTAPRPQRRRRARNSIARAPSIGCGTVRRNTTAARRSRADQWLLGTDGWGMFIHQPLGVRFSGAEGR